MPLKSFLLSFRLTDCPDRIFWQSLDKIIREELADLDEHRCIGTSINGDNGNDNKSIHLYTSSSKEIFLTVRYYDFNDDDRNHHHKKLISITGEMSQNCGELFRMNNLVEKLKDRLNTLCIGSDHCVGQQQQQQQQKMDHVEAIPILKRDNLVPSYFLTSDGRVLEYDFDKVLVNETTPFQNIKILHSPSLGNCLLLDDMQNLAEADLPYTHGLMNFGKNNYKGKIIIIK